MNLPSAMSPAGRAPTAAPERAEAGAVDAALYAGPDLHEAARKSELSAPRGGRLEGFRNAAAILADAVRNRPRKSEAPPELLVASGACPVTGERLTAAYAGRGENRAWCLSTVFERHEITDRIVAPKPDELSRFAGDVQGGVDVFFSDGLPRGSFPGVPLVSMPAWVKQRVAVLDSWPEQVAAMRRETRQEIGRFLRKYRYEAHLTQRAADHAAFYEGLYLPYVRQRFGEAAHVVGRSDFLKECGRGSLLRLTLGDAVLGAALLRPTGSAMAVVWSALDPGRTAGFRGVTDALDYFSLLYTHLRGYRWLDLGPSRPDLCDGVLRYKAKWGATIHAGLVPQATIGWHCSASPGGLNFLRRHAFLVRVRRGLRAMLAVDGDAAPDELARTLAAAANAGVHDCRVLALSAPAEILRDAVAKSGDRVSLVTAGGYPDLAHAMSDTVALQSRSRRPQWRAPTAR